MVGVGKLLKQAQKMQKKMEEAQERLTSETFDVTGGGGAVKVTINGQGELQGLTLDPDFLKEDTEFVSEAILLAVQEATAQAKEKSEKAMSELTGGMQMPGGFF